MNNGCTFNPSKQMNSWEDKDEDCRLDYFILTHIGWDTTYQSMNVKTCYQTQQSTIFDHNYMNNGCTFNPIEQLDSWENNNEDCSVDYLISTHIAWDTSDQSICILHTTPPTTLH